MLREVKSPIRGVLLSVLLACAATGGEYLLPSTPTLELFSDDILFYKGFDDESPVADMAVGQAKPVKVQGRMRLKPGLWGRALVFGDGEGVRLEYAMAANMPVPRPGALSFWVCPFAWQRGPEEPSVYFFLAYGKGVICLQRQGEMGGGRRRQNCFCFTCHGLPGIPNVTASTTSDATRRWQNGQWHLVVITWRPSLLEAYIDGEPLRSITLTRPIRLDEFATGRFRIGNLKGEPTLIDDFAIYRRPLSPAEVKALWDQRERK